MATTQFLDGKPVRQVTIALAIIERGDTFLLTRRVDKRPEWHGQWEIPGGKIDPGETTIEAVKREVWEETGLTAIDPVLLGVHTYHWHLPDIVQQTFIIVYRCSASDDPVRLSSENDAYQWLDLAGFYQLDKILGANLEMIRELYEPVVCTRGNQ